MATDYDVLQKYFDILESTLKKNLIFNNPSRIFNCDETGLPLNPKCAKVVSRRGAKNVSNITGEGKSQITVLACTCASGISLPPFIIFDRMSHNYQLMSGEIPGTLYGSSTNGWIDQELFLLWFHKLFLMSVPKVRPLLLIMDGHSSHYSPDFIQIAAKEQMIIFVLPPHTTHLTQPLDKGCFGPLKTAWKAVCHEFYCKNPDRAVTRFDFSALFAETWRRAMTQRNITGGFRITGIYPFNRSALEVNDGKQEGKQDTSQQLLKETGLAYIPMYSTEEGSRSRESPDLEDEPPRLERSLSEGDLSRTLTPLRRKTAIEDFLKTPPHPSCLPTKNPKCCARVVTSFEYMEIMEEKERN